MNQRDIKDIWLVTISLAVLFVVGILVFGLWKLKHSNDHKGTRPGRQLDQFLSPGR